MAAFISAAPPSAKYTITGAKISAKIISEACSVSVQLTAKKPPINV